ncbi:amino acid/polyamine transporter I [Aspergillus stella-maris]|uniref:amino acid/polyamine transporter I n=1 Tax=Aspergillus stella-maris TaxID=1810926 RepID=UPI003CCD6D2B
MASSYATIIPWLRLEWSPSTGQLVGIGYGLQLVWLLLVSLRMERFHAAILIIAGAILAILFVFIIAIPATHAGLPFNNAARVFTTYVNFFDWNRSAALPLTFFTSVFTTGGWAASVYVVEETHDGTRSVPKAMVSSYILTSALGFILCIITAFCTTDIAASASGPTGYPMYTLVSDNFGVRGGGAFFLISVIFASMGGCSTLLTKSSQLASLAHDGGLPFSKTFAYIYASNNMPIPAALLLTIGSMLILLSAFSSEAATIIYSLADPGSFLDRLVWAVGVLLFMLTLLLRLSSNPYGFGVVSFLEGLDCGGVQL